MDTRSLRLWKRLRWCLTPCVLGIIACASSAQLRGANASNVPDDSIARNSLQDVQRSLKGQRGPQRCDGSKFSDFSREVIDAISDMSADDILHEEVGREIQNVRLVLRGKSNKRYSMEIQLSDKRCSIYEIHRVVE